jgi:hypothetical protein
VYLHRRANPQVRSLSLERHALGHFLQQPEPEHAVRPTALFVDAPHGPVTTVDGEVLPVLVESTVGRIVSGMS